MKLAELQRAQVPKPTSQYFSKNVQNKRGAESNGLKFRSALPYVAVQMIRKRTEIELAELQRAQVTL
jgi:hypothetical protein